MPNVIMLGDVVGEPGLLALEALLPPLLAETALTVVNGENAAAGFGLTPETFQRIIAAGADVVTSGNHVWEKREFWPVLESGTPILRPANYPAGSAGRGWLVLEKSGLRYAVINLQGRAAMPQTDCPFRTLEGLLALPEIRGASGGVFVDFHAESTEEKEALGFFADGLAASGSPVSCVAGTHTHIQTADERLLPGGTAYITDLGMTGNPDSVIGMDSRICLERSRTQVPIRMEPAGGETLELQGLRLCLEKGRAVQIERMRMRFP